MRGGMGSRKESLRQPGVGCHRATDIHQQQQLDVVSSLGSEDKFKLAGVAGGRLDRLFQVEFFTPSLPGKFPQVPERDPHLSHIQDPIMS